MKHIRKQINHLIKIEFEAGSVSQEEIQLSSIRMMIGAWKEHCEQAHKKNKIKVEETKQDTIKVDMNFEKAKQVMIDEGSFTKQEFELLEKYSK
jgi:hypothetical protein